MKSLKTLILILSLISFPGIAYSASELTISAAISLHNVFTELKSIFEKKHPGLIIQTNFAASNPLLHQIEAGAPADIFASADQDTMDKAAQTNSINPLTRKNFAMNELVVVVPKGRKVPEKLADLINYNKIAIGNPYSVPAGRYAKSAIEKDTVWNILQNAFIQGENVRQVLDYVARDEADAGFVYRTDALQAKDKVDIAFVVKNTNPITYPFAITVNSSNPELAEEFINFVLSDHGCKILEKYGFITP